MALKDERPVLLFGTLCVLAAGYLFLIYPRAPRVIPIHNIETTMRWTDGPNVKLDPQRMKELNDEVDSILTAETHGQQIHYPVVSLDKRWVEVMYIGDASLPDALREKLDAHIRQRLPELAREQVTARP